VRDYAALLNDDGPPNATVNGFPENLALFADGKCAMWIDSTVAAGLLYNPQISKVADLIELAPAPTAATETGSHWLWSWALAIPSTSQQKPAALEFIAWATSKSYIASVADLMGWGSAPPGTRYSTYQNKNYQTVAPYAPLVLSALESADPRNATLNPSPYIGVQFVTTPSFADFGNAVGQNIADVVDKKVSVDAVGALNQEAVLKVFRKGEN
jgi:sorbitol/mannitol transport system substrate-binding protein